MTHEQTEERNWGAEQWRAPKLQDGDSLIYDECGRVLDNVCYRSHYFRLVLDSHGSGYLLVKHGGGEERIGIGYPNKARRLIAALKDVDSDNRYIAFYVIYDAARNARIAAQDATAMHYKKAFVEGRLKKRKLPAQGRVKVWIEHPPITGNIVKIGATQL